MIRKFPTDGRNPLKSGCAMRNDIGDVGLSLDRLGHTKPSIAMTSHEAIAPFR